MGSLFPQLQNQGLLISNGVSLSPAILLNMIGNDFTLVPSPGPNLIIIPQFLLFKFKYGGVVYNPNGATLSSRMGGLTLNFTGLPNPTGTWDQANDSITYATFNAQAFNPAIPANAPLLLRCNIANPTLGNGTLDVLAYYLLASTQ